MFVVVGASGSIGGTVARTLRAHGESVRAVVRDTSRAADLAAVGCELLRRVAANPGGGRELALDLLAADAFVTYAFEAQADADPAGLAALAGRVEREVRAT